jgi:hypothetical protein
MAFFIVTAVITSKSYKSQYSALREEYENKVTRFIQVD